jgi:type VI secretion system protein ImpL
MLRPRPAPKTTGYSIEIDGQNLDYRNGAPQWANFVWPSGGGVPGARIVATTFDGRSLDILNFPGRYGLEKMINSAQRMRQPDGTFRLSWGNQDAVVTVDLRIISSPQAKAAPQGDAEARRGLGGTIPPPTIAGAADPVPAEPGAQSASEIGDGQ